MFFALLFALIAIFAGAKLEPDFRRDYLSRSSTGAINGIFVLLIFLSHATSYLPMDGTGDNLYIVFQLFLGQLIVTTFLFYSGYGMMTSFLKKGADYVRTVFPRRFCRVFLHFDLAVLLYIPVRFLIGEPPTPGAIAYALITWGSLGNSNWYITAVLCLYLIFLVSFAVFRKHPLAGLITASALTLALFFFFRAIGRSAFTYNTILLFPFGMWYAYLAPHIEKLLWKNRAFYFGALALAVVAFAYLWRRKGGHSLWFSAFGCAFVAIIVLTSMRLKVSNPVLDFFGQHVFSIYILERIPMILLQHFGFAQNGFVFVIASLALTVPLALGFDFAMAKLDTLLFDRKKAVQ